MNKLIVAFCTYNRAARLPALIAALSSQDCPIPFEILAIDNNSADETFQTLALLASQTGKKLRFVRESVQGITYARNRALAEARNADYLVFLDDDELPRPGFLSAAYKALHIDGADCVGGRVHVSFNGCERPRWLTDDLLGHFAQLNYGDEPYWITDPKQPVWTANCGYRMTLFDDLGLRFDKRYNRAGQGVGGGEDTVMFRELLVRGMRIRYEPNMEVDHFIEPWRLKHSYFMKLHFVNGRRFGQYGMPTYPGSFIGIPLFLVRETLERAATAAKLWFTGQPEAFTASLGAVHRVGCLWGDSSVGGMHIIPSKHPSRGGAGTTMRKAR